MTKEVLFSVNNNGVAFITLNRPKAINSLSYEMVTMIGQKLKEWEKDDQVLLVILTGAGTKGFCAGGDIKALYEARVSQSALHNAEQFFEEEYKVDQFIYTFSKPIIACLDGIVMGGGVGLTYGASYKVVTERTKWAMPEMNIGFFPDVGAAYFLNKAPGYIGRYLALTGAVIEAADVMYINGADHYMPYEKLNAFLSDVEEIHWHDRELDSTIKQLINNYSEELANESQLASLQEDIDHHFSFPTVEAILASLEEKQSNFAMKTKQTLLSKSPSSLKVTLQQLIEGEEKTLKECFATDLTLAKNFLKHKDFFEGVRSVLIDKDKNPRYMYKHLSDVSEEMVTSFFI
jgi:enoyl-CoA hydratase/carnithine racemase